MSVADLKRELRHPRVRAALRGRHPRRIDALDVLALWYVEKLLKIAFGWHAAALATGRVDTLGPRLAEASHSVDPYLELADRLTRRLRLR